MVYKRMYVIDDGPSLVGTARGPVPKSRPISIGGY